MSEDLLASMREAVKSGDKQLNEIRDLIAKLKTAGEPVKELERQYLVTKARVERYKKAFLSKK